MFDDDRSEDHNIPRKPLDLSGDDDEAMELKKDAIVDDLVGSSGSKVRDQLSGADMYEPTDGISEAMTEANLEDVVRPVKESFEELRRKINQKEA